MIAADSLTAAEINHLLEEAHLDRDLVLRGHCYEALGLMASAPEDRERRILAGRELCAAELRRRAGYRAPMYGVES